MISSQSGATTKTCEANYLGNEQFYDELVRPPIISATESLGKELSGDGMLAVSIDSVEHATRNFRANAKQVTILDLLEKRSYTRVSVKN